MRGVNKGRYKRVVDEVCEREEWMKWVDRICGQERWTCGRAAQVTWEGETYKREGCMIGQEYKRKLRQGYSRQKSLAIQERGGGDW